MDAITPFIGFPDKLPEIYSRLKTTSGSLYEDALKFDEILTARTFEKFSEDVDKTSWHMPAHMVNAYYSPDSNTIVFPAAILQAPFTLLNNLHHKITVESAQLLLTKFLTLLITTVPNSIKKEI